MITEEEEEEEEEEEQEEQRKQQEQEDQEVDDEEEEDEQDAEKKHAVKKTRKKIRKRKSYRKNTVSIPKAFKVRADLHVLAEVAAELAESNKRAKISISDINTSDIAAPISPILNSELAEHAVLNGLQTVSSDDEATPTVVPRPETMVRDSSLNFSFPQLESFFGSQSPDTSDSVRSPLSMVPDLNLVPIPDLDRVPIPDLNLIPIPDLDLAPDSSSDETTISFTLL